MARYLGIDVGIKNLSLCELVVEDRSTVRIVRWNVVALANESRPKLDDVIPSLVHVLKYSYIETANTCTRVCVERQVGNRNWKMLAMGTAIQAAFLALSLDPTHYVLCSARQKFAQFKQRGIKEIEAPECADVRRRPKVESMKIVDYLLNKRTLVSNIEIRKYQEATKKHKENLADAFGIIIGHLLDEDKLDI